MVVQRGVHNEVVHQGEEVAGEPKENADVVQLDWVGDLVVLESEVEIADNRIVLGEDVPRMNGETQNDEQDFD